MKSLFSSFILLAAGLLVLERALILAETFTQGVRVSPETVTLKPGEYVWEPERAPEGPLLIVASITEQVAYVYRNGIRIARSSCSTGRPGHRTPTGVFTILEKEVHHTSSIYKGAEMPYMERVRAPGKCDESSREVRYVKHGCFEEFGFLLVRNGETSMGFSVVIFPRAAMRHSSLWREDFGAAFGCAQSRPVMDRRLVELRDIGERRPQQDPILVREKLGDLAHNVPVGALILQRTALLL
jgi:hypothetical protein